MTISKLLQRQIRKCLGELSPAETEKLSSFLSVVDQAYQAYEDDLILMERSLEISSDELIEKNELLKQENQNSKAHTNFLEKAINRSSAVVYRAEFAEGELAVDFVSDNISKYGYTAEDLTSGKVNYFGECIHPEDAPVIWEQLLQAVKETQEEVYFDYRLLNSKKAEGWGWIQISAKLFYDERGTFQWMEGVAIDIHDRKMNQLRVESEKSRLNAILQSIGDGVIVFDADEKITLCNKSARVILGMKKGIRGKRLSEMGYLATKGWKYDHKDLFGKAKSTGRSQRFSGNLILLHGDQKSTPIDCIVSGVETEDSTERKSSVMVLRDVTQEREIDRMKTEFVSIASHQLQTPVTAISWMLELLNDPTMSANLTQDQKSLCDDMEKNARRMSKLIAGLLDVSRIESGRKFAVVKSPYNIYKCLEEALEENRLNAQKKSLDLIVHSEFPRDLKLNIDGPKIKEVFHNFISNAIKYSGESKCVTIGAQQKKNEIIFSIQDRGIGIPEAEKSYIFKRFYRASNTAKTKSQGTGLGLYIARRVVEAHGGEVWFDSQPTVGTTFYFGLPIS